MVPNIQFQQNVNSRRGAVWDHCHFFDFRLNYAKVKRTLSMKPLYSLLSTVKCIKMNK